MHACSRTEYVDLKWRYNGTWRAEEEHVCISLVHNASLDLGSNLVCYIREKYMIVKISMLIIFTVLGSFSCILGVFRVFAFFCRHCFSSIHEKYTLANILVGHSRTITAREIYPVYSMMFF